MDACAVAIKIVQCMIRMNRTPDPFFAAGSLSIGDYPPARRGSGELPILFVPRRIDSLSIVNWC